MDSYFGFQNVSPCYTTERSQDFAPLLARTNLAKLCIQLLKLPFFPPCAVNHPDDLMTSPSGIVLPPLNKCKAVSSTCNQEYFGVHQEGSRDKKLFVVPRETDAAGESIFKEMVPCLGNESL